MSDYRLDQNQNVTRVADGAMIPSDAGNRDYQAYLAWVASGNTADPYVPPALTEADYLAEVGKLLDGTVQERFYDDIVSACSYAASTNAKFKAEADACIAWRDAVYVACYTALAAVQGGTMEQPTIAAFVASLPQLAWPT